MSPLKPSPSDARGLTWITPYTGSWVLFILGILAILLNLFFPEVFTHLISRLMM